jgi:hypothetical protein
MLQKLELNVKSPIYNFFCFFKFFIISARSDKKGADLPAPFLYSC